MADSGRLKEYDVIILGAGPGGCSCALTLKDAGLRVAIIDKSDFPRDKVCGELMHRKTVTTLNSIIPEFEDEFKKYPKTSVLKRTKVHYKGKVLDFEWVNESYTCPRYELDNFMLGIVRKKTNADIFTGTQPEKIERTEDGFTISIKGSSNVFSAKLIIGADGAHSMVAKTLAAKKLEKEHYLGAVRAYYSNINDLDNNVSEVFFNTKYQFNYLWVFPVKGGIANVGFGMLSSNISKNKINLKDAFYDHFKQSAELGQRFDHAEQVSPLEGFGVPLGSTIGIPSGDGFMLVGDAASLSNPLSGTGMGNAVLSGKIAGLQAIKCFNDKDFSGTFMKQYDDAIQKAIVNDLMASYKAQKLLSKMPFMLDVVFWLGKYDRVKKYIQSIV